MKFLVTGTAGFIGFHLARRLLAEGHIVTGVDGFTAYYDTGLKRARHALLAGTNAFQAHEFMLEDSERFMALAGDVRPDVIVHLAAQAGVRYSLENPRAYVNSNLLGTFTVMEAAREISPRHFLMASTSSVYGANTKMPLTELDKADHPLTIYAATKKAAEEMTHSYAHLWKIPTTMFRFFTVYGPWGRPDMAFFKFVRAAIANEPIDVYGNGQMRRDFTYVDDLVEAIVRLVPCVPEEGAPAGEVDSLSPAAPHRIVNIGGGQPLGLLEFIDEIERAVGVPVKRNFMEMQKGDVRETFASPELLELLTGYVPRTSLRDGIEAFVAWYRDFYCDPVAGGGTL